MPQDFRLYHGNDLELLAGLLAEELARPLPGALHMDVQVPREAEPAPDLIRGCRTWPSLLAPDTILVPQPAVRRWLQKTLAERHGIAANLRFLAPGEFVRLLLDANVPATGTPAGDATVLRWRLWRELADPARLTAPAFAPILPALAGTDPALEAWQLAGALAQAFEKYQAWRRDWLLRWDAGAEKDDWQAELWRRATKGTTHRARRLDTYLAKFATPGSEAIPAGVPARVFAFACQNVSPDVLRAIASAGRAGPVHFYFVSPVRGWWGDLRTVRERLDDAHGCASAAGGGMPGAAADAAFADDEHPLLRANGAAGRDFVRTLFGYDVAHPSYEQAVYVGPDPELRTGLLHRIQRDLLERTAPRCADLAHEAIADASLQVHACHTRLREVQVLHDRLRDLLEADPTLQPRDIAVLAPDLAPYAPLVDAVFGGEPARSAIPYALADGLALAAKPAARVFAQLLALPQSRFGAEEVLDLLAQPLLSERFDLAPRDFMNLRDWLDAAGARWGLDAAHRASLGAPDDGAYTWSWALDRLLLGHATGEDDDVAGVAPLPTLDGGDLAVLDRALHGLRRLAHWQRALAAPRPAAEWATLLAALLDDVFPAHPRESDDRALLETLRARLAQLGEEATQAGPGSSPGQAIDAAVPASVVRAWCADALADDNARAPLLTGGVTFARMVPMRWVPFKVICLLGMDDDAFPRREAPGGLNRLAGARDAGQRRVGDPSVRDDDRGLFLQLLGAATQALHVSYLGQDPRTHEPRPPSVCVAELLDVAATYFADPGAARAGFTVVHPLQPFAAAAFGGGVAPDPRRRGYRADWQAAAVAATGPRAPASPFASAVRRAGRTNAAEGRMPVSGPPREVIAADDWTMPRLLRALANPAREFLESRLGVALPRSDERLDDAEPFATDDGLARWQRTARALALCLADPDLHADALAQRLLAEGRVPPGAAGRAVAHATLDAIAPALAAWSAGPRVHSREYALELGGIVLRGTLPGVHRDGLRQFSASKPHGKTVLALGLDALAWSALGETAPIDRLVRDAPRATIAPLDAEAARRKLRGLVEFAARAGQQVLPFAPKTGLELARGGDPDKVLAAARRQWNGDDRLGWSGEGDDAWVRMALRGAEPFVDAAATTALIDNAKEIFEGLPGVADAADTEDAA